MTRIPPRMSDKEAKEQMRDIMETSEAVYVTTIDENGFPQTRALLNLRNKKQYPKLVFFFQNHQDDLVTYFSTNTSSPKVTQIKVNPRASAYYCRPTEFRGVMLGGFIEIVPDLETKKAIWQEEWEFYYPTGVEDPDNTLLRLRPLIAKYYHQLQHYVFDIRGEP